MFSLVSTMNASMLVQSNLAASSARTADSIQSLSSGSKLASSSLGSSDKALAGTLQKIVVEQRQVAYNISMATSVMQTASNAMLSMGEMLTRIKAITVLASNDALAMDERATLALEAKGLVAQLQQTAEMTSFGGGKLLNGTALDQDGNLVRRMDMPLGVSVLAPDAPAQTLTLTIMNVENAQLFGGGEIDVSSTELAQISQGFVNQAIKKLGLANASAGGQISVLNYRLEHSRSMMLYGSDARKQIADTDIPLESTLLSQSTLAQQVAISLLGQLHQISGESLRLIDQQA